MLVVIALGHLLPTLHALVKDYLLGYLPFCPPFLLLWYVHLLIVLLIVSCSVQLLSFCFLKDILV